MLGEAGSIASLVGVGVSFLGLWFAIVQLMKLRGETRAAREAAEATRRSMGRDLTIADISRTFERIEHIKQAHRAGEWNRALSGYSEVRRALLQIRGRYPGLPQYATEKVQLGVDFLQYIERTVDVTKDRISEEIVGIFNQGLTDIQQTLADLESQLDQSI